MLPFKQHRHTGWRKQLGMGAWWLRYLLDHLNSVATLSAGLTTRGEDVPTPSHRATQATTHTQVALRT
jgi:hypothetical protein